MINKSRPSSRDFTLSTSQLPLILNPLLRRCNHLDKLRYLPLLTGRKLADLAQRLHYLGFLLWFLHGDNQTSLQHPNINRCTGIKPRVCQPAAFKGDGGPGCLFDYGQQRTHGSLGYDSNGKVPTHEHKVTYNERGYLDKKYYREIDKNGKAVGPWISEK